MIEDVEGTSKSDLAVTLTPPQMCVGRTYLERHALLYGTVTDDVDDIADLVLLQVGGQRDVPGLLVVAREGYPTSSVSMTTLSSPLFMIDACIP